MLKPADCEKREAGLSDGLFWNRDRRMAKPP